MTQINVSHFTSWRRNTNLTIQKIIKKSQKHDSVMAKGVVRMKILTQIQKKQQKMRQKWSQLSPPSPKHLLALSCKVGKLPVSLAVDTGATINVMSDTSFRAIRRSLRGGHWNLFPNDLNVVGVSGLNLEILGKIQLKINPGKTVCDFHAFFYITNSFALPVDAILGLNTLKCRE